jgi:hypothetical protein
MQDHRLGIHHLQTRLKVGHQVGRHEGDAIGIAHRGFKDRPFAY